MAAPSATKPSPTSDDAAATATAVVVAGATMKDSTAANDGGPAAAAVATDVSPSSTATTTASSSTTVEVPTAAEATTAAPASLSSKKKKEPTYEETKQSAYYLASETWMKQGAFAEALEMIEEAIEATTTTLASEGGDIEIHEALAPYHYLYGTTLLYSIEEDTSQSMTVSQPGQVVQPAAAAADGAAAGGFAAAASEEEEEEDAATVPVDGSAAVTMAGHDAAMAMQMMMAQQAAAEEAETEAPPEDLEIAWENLEAARTAIEKKLLPARRRGLGQNVDQIQLDLAQIYLRIGDLQRLNRNYENAVRDYHSCLTIRLASPLLAVYDRKKADVHYQLGLAYTMLVAEACNAKDQEDEEQGQQPSSSNNSNKDGTTPAQHVAKMARCRGHSYYHLLACCVMLCGHIAELCGADGAAIIRQAEQQAPQAASGGKSSGGAPRAQLKSTGEDDEDDTYDQVEDPKIAGLKLQSLRKSVATLAPTDKADTDKVNDLREMLDEIQETIDESENAEKGVSEVSDMKAEISAAVAGTGFPGGADGKSGAADGEQGGTTTTIGFGPAAASLSAQATTMVGAVSAAAAASTTSSTSVGFATASAASSSSAAAATTPQPVMMIKKKKRTDGSADPNKRSKVASE